MEATQRIFQRRAVEVAIGGPRDSNQREVRAILGALAWSLAGALFLSSAWLLFRRLTGELGTPLEGGVLASVGVCAVLCAATARLLWRGATYGTANSLWRFRDGLPTVALVFIATSASVPGSSVAAIVLLWTMIAAEEIAAAWIARLPVGPNRAHAIATRHRKRGLKTRSGAREQSSTDEETFRDVLQHHTRLRMSDGGELVHGTLRAGFVAGQRTAIEHLVFCPMLAAAPRITTKAIDESDCAVRATHVYRYGARLEIRLPEPCDEPVEVLVRYEARG
jgi:hypothetical protein